MNNFIILTKHDDNKRIIIRNDDIINVLETDECCIVRYLSNGTERLEHIKESPTEIYTMLTYNIEVPGLTQKHLNS